MENKPRALPLVLEMFRGLVRCGLVGMTGFLIACGENKAPGKPKAEKTAAEELRENRLYYDNYLYQCPENEVRCLWFADKDMKVGMLMWLDTITKASYTLQNGEKHPLLGKTVKTIDSDILEQQKAKLVAATPTVNFAEDVHIAFWYKGKLLKRSYSRSDIPQAVQRIYEIGGVPLDFKVEK